MSCKSFYRANVMLCECSRFVRDEYVKNGLRSSEWKRLSTKSEVISNRE